MSSISPALFWVCKLERRGEVNEREIKCFIIPTKENNNNSMYTKFHTVGTAVYTFPSERWRGAWEKLEIAAYNNKIC